MPDRRPPIGTRSAHHDRFAGYTAMAVAALSMAACAETVRPVLGGLRIGPQKEGPFATPSLVTEQIPFAYPEDAWNRGVGGETLLRLHISSAGNVDSVAVVTTSGDRVLDSAAVAGAWRLRYRPARYGDSPVAVWALLPVRYPMPKAAEAGR